MTQKSHTNRPVAWLLVFSLCIAGCYPPTVVRPALEEENVFLFKISRNDITSVVTTDGIAYMFEKPPDVDENLIVGEAKVRVTEGFLATRAAIPLSEVSEVSVKEINATLTTVSIVFGIVMISGIIVSGKF